MNFLPHTEEDVRRALAAIGVDTLDDLFADIPNALLDPELDLPSGMDEVSLLAHLRALAAKNDVSAPSFLGGGVQRHFIPTVTPHLAMQSEFVTAYTPYQPEVAQGILQATFEYQTIMCELTGLDVSNASMYDGASATAEAALLAVRQTGRSAVMVSAGVHPQTREVLATYLSALEIELRTQPLAGMVSANPQVAEDCAALIVQSPNFLGAIEPMSIAAEAAHQAGALLIAVVDPLSLALLAPPGEYGADIAVGDGQTLGNPPSFGGPSFGFMVVTERLVRQMPGRLVGQTIDVDGRRAFVLTLQAREQHIRRSKAKSNICSNHQLTALMAAVNVGALGPAGLAQIARASVANAHRLADALEAAGGEVVREARFFNEFVLRVGRPPAELRRELWRRGVHAGVPVPEDYGLGQAVILAATELSDDDGVAALLGALTDLGELEPEVSHV